MAEYSLPLKTLVQCFILFHMYDLALTLWLLFHLVFLSQWFLWQWGRLGQDWKNPSFPQRLEAHQWSSHKEPIIFLRTSFKITRDEGSEGNGKLVFLTRMPSNERANRSEQTLKQFLISIKFLKCSKLCSWKHFAYLKEKWSLASNN